MEQNKQAVFRTPFSRKYWIQAYSELKNPRMIAFAALIVALRIAMKPLRIPVATDVNITFGFIANAFGSMVYGPVIALLSGAISDTLGYLVAPNGEYCFLFIIPEMMGSFVFALFLYKTEISAWRLILSKFSINAFVNVIISEPIMVHYYQVHRPMPYEPFLWIRIVKNIVMLPLEALILIIVFKSLMPPMSKHGFCTSGIDALKLTRKHIVLIAALVLIGAGSVAGYVIYDYNTKTFSKDYTAEERLLRNLGMKARVMEEAPGLKADETVVVIDEARSQVGNREMKYLISIYSIDPEAFEKKHFETEQKIKDGNKGIKPYTIDFLNGYSKSKPSGDKTLRHIGSGIVILDKYTEERISVELKWDEGSNQ